MRECLERIESCFHGILIVVTTWDQTNLGQWTVLGRLHHELFCVLSNTWNDA